MGFEAEADPQKGMHGTCMGLGLEAQVRLRCIQASSTKRHVFSQTGEAPAGCEGRGGFQNAILPPARRWVGPGRHQDLVWSEV